MVVDKNDSTTGPKGLINLKRFVVSAPENPGVYKMISTDHEIIYIGKAKNIKNRIKSYTNFAALPTRLQLMVSMIGAVEFEVTANELEALFFEANLINKHKPRFNILLREPKNYNYIVVTEHEYPRITKAKEGGGTGKEHRFGPYYSGNEAGIVLDCLCSAFKARTCTDKAFSSRTRPCLRYHIKQCSAPCCGRVSGDNYSNNIKSIIAFLSGHSVELQSELSQKMDQSSENKKYEEAAVYRDQIRILTKIQTVQKVHVGINAALDVIGLACSTAGCCVQVNEYRYGVLSNNRVYFLDVVKDDSGGNGYSDEFILTEFVKQYYQSAVPPECIFTSHELCDLDLIKQFFSQKSGHLVKVLTPKRGINRDIVMTAVMKAQSGLASKKFELKDDSAVTAMLAEMLGINQSGLMRIEIYDNSHIQGSFAYGAMVVYEVGKGFNKSKYRLFKMQESHGDDYAMMENMLNRRFSKPPDADIPSLLIIDGGMGQLKAAQKCINNSDNSDVKVISIAKGVKRNAGDEKIYFNDRMLEIEKKSPLMYFLQRLRDEAHRFAISSHRNARGKSLQKSMLDGIPGIGSKRRRAILVHFGSVANIATASVADLYKVNGISRGLAENIFKYTHKIDKS